jgi:hypothetical protein
MDQYQSSPNDKLVRTQIMLPQSLRRQIEAAKPSSQSLGDYLRQAAKHKLNLDRKAAQSRKKELKELAHQLIGSLDLKNYPEWSTPEKVIKWQKEMRAEWDRS